MKYHYRPSRRTRINTTSFGKTTGFSHIPSTSSSTILYLGKCSPVSYKTKDTLSLLILPLGIHSKIIKIYAFIYTFRKMVIANKCQKLKTTQVFIKIIIDIQWNISQCEVTSYFNKQCKWISNIMLDQRSKTQKNTCFDSIFAKWKRQRSEM
jgi:hypothetical protein